MASSSVPPDGPRHRTRMVDLVPMSRPVEVFFRVCMPWIFAAAFAVVTVLGFRQNVWTGVVCVVASLPVVWLGAVRLYRLLRRRG